MTAVFVAAVRARENQRRDRLFVDDLSSRLAGPEGVAWLAASEANPHSNYRRDSFPYLEVRTRFFDDWALEGVNDYGARQLVVLGAGMDTRAFRLRWPPELRVWEVDTQELFALKESRLQAARARAGCDRVVVEADLTSRAWVGKLLGRGFRKETLTLWLAEGLFQYLAGKDVIQILEDAASISSQGSRFGAEIISEDYLRRPSKEATLNARKDRGTPWIFGTNDPGTLFRSHGWVVEDKVSAQSAATAYGRWPASPAPGTARPRAGLPGACFVSATRASATKRGAKRRRSSIQR